MLFGLGCRFPRELSAKEVGKRPLIEKNVINGDFQQADHAAARVIAAKANHVIHPLFKGDIGWSAGGVIRIVRLVDGECRLKPGGAAPRPVKIVRLAETIPFGRGKLVAIRLWVFIEGPGRFIGGQRAGGREKGREESCGAGQGQGRSSAGQSVREPRR